MAKRERTNGQTTVYKSLHRNTNIAKNWEWTQVLWKGKQFLFHLWHLSCYYCYHQVISYEKRNIYVVICDMDTPLLLTKPWLRPYNFQSHDFNLATRNHWFSSFFNSSNLFSNKSWTKPQALEYRVNWEIYTPYAVAIIFMGQRVMNDIERNRYTRRHIIQTLKYCLKWR
jgi:hypothetical protein